LHCLHSAIHSNSPLQLGRKVLDCRAISAAHRQSMINFVEETKFSIANRTFRPLKHTDPRGGRLFTLLPIYSTHPRYMTINKQAFSRLLVDANLEQNCTLDDNQTFDRYTRYFDFTTIGFPSVESVRTERVQFW
jgi:hypothetical protein